jgi:sugar-specific transcriptional regulator TrmB
MKYVRFFIYYLLTIDFWKIPDLGQMTLQYHRLSGQTGTNPERMIFERNAELLTEFGLTGNQAKIYCATVKLGPASVEMISNESGVRREDVYRILPRLIEMGIVEKLITNPTKIKAQRVEMTIFNLIKNRRETTMKELAALTEKSERFFEEFRPFKETIHSDQDEASQFSLVTGHKAVAAKEIDIIGNAQEEIIIMASPGTPFTFLFENAGILRAALKRRVSVHVVTDETAKFAFRDDTSGKDLEKFTFDLRFGSSQNDDFIIADQREALVNTSEKSPEKRSSLWTTNESLISLFYNTYLRASSESYPANRRITSAPSAHLRRIPGHS